MVDAHTDKITPEVALSRVVRREGIPVVTGYGVEDLRALPLQQWQRLGGPAAYCHLEGSQGFVGALVAEIPPGKSLEPMRHLYEEQILILEGRGATTFWSDSTKQTTTLEWHAGALFSPPLNTRHQHFNGAGNEPVRFVAVNNAPLIFNVYKSAEFIFNNPFEFTERYAGESGYFSSELKPGELEDTSVNFIPDVYAVPLDYHPDKGVGFSRLGVNLSGNAMVGHIMQVESGTYRKAHRHAAGAQVIVLGGKGYSLMWPPGGDFIRVDWRKGSLPGAARRMVSSSFYHERTTGKAFGAPARITWRRASMAAHFKRARGRPSG